MAIDPVTALQNATFSSQPASQSHSDLSTVDFMQLMIAQLRNQNPLSESQDPTDFMGQMAQFEMLTKLSAVSDGITVMQGLNELSGAAALIGKSVVGEQADGLSITADLVAREMFGQSFDRLTQQQRDQVAADPRIQQALDDQATVGREISGTVEKVVVGEDGIPMLFVNGRVVDLFTVSVVE